MVATLLAEGPPLFLHANRFTPSDHKFSNDSIGSSWRFARFPRLHRPPRWTPALALRYADGRKLLFRGRKGAARTIILDPQANLEVPASVMTTTGMNALADCVEGPFSERPQSAG